MGKTHEFCIILSKSSDGRHLGPVVISPCLSSDIKNKHLKEIKDFKLSLVRTLNGKFMSKAKLGFFTTSNCVLFWICLQCSCSSQGQSSIPNALKNSGPRTVNNIMRKESFIVTLLVVLTSGRKLHNTNETCENHMSTVWAVICHYGRQFYRLSK